MWMIELAAFAIFLLPFKAVRPFRMMGEIKKDLGRFRDAAIKTREMRPATDAAIEQARRDRGVKR